jgi:hypothetical protein
MSMFYTIYKSIKNNLQNPSGILYSTILTTYIGIKVNNLSHIAKIKIRFEKKIEKNYLCQYKFKHIYILIIID